MSITQVSLILAIVFLTLPGSQAQNILLHVILTTLFRLSFFLHPVLSCVNVTDCLTCAKSNFAKQGTSPCSWCLTSGSCFDRFAFPDQCNPASTVVLSDAGSRCNLLLGLPTGYGVFIIIIIILIPIAIIAAVIIIRRRIRDKQIEDMIEHAEEQSRAKRPISVSNPDYSSHNTGIALDGPPSPKTGTRAPVRRHSRRISRATSGKRDSAESAPRREPLIDDSTGKDNRKDDPRAYVPPTMSASNPSSTSPTKIKVTPGQKSLPQPQPDSPKKKKENEDDDVVNLSEDSSDD